MEEIRAQEEGLRRQDIAGRSKLQAIRYLIDPKLDTEADLKTRFWKELRVSRATMFRYLPPDGKPFESYLAGQGVEWLVDEYLRPRNKLIETETRYAGLQAVPDRILKKQPITAKDMLANWVQLYMRVANPAAVSIAATNARALRNPAASNLLVATQTESLIGGLNLAVTSGMGEYRHATEETGAFLLQVCSAFDRRNSNDQVINLVLDTVLQTLAPSE